MPAELTFAVPGDLDSRTGGYVYDKRLIAELRALGWQVDHLRWPEGFPAPNAAELAQTEASLAELPDGATVLVDGLAFGALGEMALRHAGRLRLVALVHHPLALETGIAPELAATLAASERLALTAARAVVTTSRTTAEILVDQFAVPEPKITVAPPGTDPAKGPRGERQAGPLRLLAVGSVIPRKGFDLLVEALAGLADLPWTCRIAGSTERSPETHAALVTRIAAAGLDGRIRFLGEVSDVPALYREADLFVLPSRYEGYGMVFAEALAHGLPIVGAATGAVPEVVPAGAGILVPPDDAGALGRALRDVMADQALQTSLSAGARAAAAALPRWSDTARLVASALARID